MSPTNRLFSGLAALLLLTVSPAAETEGEGSSGQAAFQRMMMEAMSRMDKDMAISHSGDADRDFAAMMIPHHQGAIDMAKAELQFGRNPVLRRLAQGIIVEQQQEIELMRRELGRMPAAPHAARH